jgi:hypothetical protein
MIGRYRLRGFILYLLKAARPCASGSCGFMVFSITVLKHCNDGLRHQFNELSFSFRLYRWTVRGGLVVLECQGDLLHGSAPGVSPTSP